MFYQTEVTAIPLTLKTALKKTVFRQSAQMVRSATAKNAHATEKNGLSYFSGDDIYKRHIERDCKILLYAVQSVMEGKGNPENIQEAILNLNASNYSYQSYLKEKHLRGKEVV